MSDSYHPTPYLRFVVRREIGSGPDGKPVELRTARVLQQRWHSVYVGDPDEWRDVPDETEQSSEDSPHG